MPSVTIQHLGSASIDTQIVQGNPTFNYGTRNLLDVDNSGIIGRGLVKIDVSSIPANAVISSAVLRIFGTAEAGTYKVHRAITQWFEGASNGAVPGAGVNASTWNHRNANGSVAWAGGAGGGSGSDYVAAASDTKVYGSGSAGPFDFNVLADVQGMVNGSITNNGWWVISSNNWLAMVTGEWSGSSGSALLVTYKVLGPMHGTAVGTSTVTGTLVEGDYGPLTIQPNPATSKDTRVLQETPVQDQGTSTILSAGWGGTGIRRALLQFDLSALPPSANIQRAAVVMYMIPASSGLVNNVIEFHRSLVDWHEGNSTSSPPGAGVDASVWNFRNYNGSVAWAGGAGGQSGTEWVGTPSASRSFTANSAAPFEWEVTQDIQDFVDGTYPNYGWWIVGQSETNPGAGTFSSKAFHSSDYTTDPARRPYLVVDYVDPSIEMSGLAEGTSTATATLTAIGYMSGLAEGTSNVEGVLVSNAAAAATAGVSTVTGTLTAIGYMHGTAAGSSTATAIIRARVRLSGSSAGLATVSAEGSFAGMLRGSAAGLATVSGTMWGKATGKRILEICDTTPLLYITDGSYLPNGQLDMLNLLSTRIGFILKDWEPNLAQYKGGGYFSDSALGQGRRLSRRVFENAIEVMSLSLRGDHQNQAIYYIREYLRWQELAADYWTSDWSIRPVYLVARSGKETQTRYAIIHVMSMPAIKNPYAQPFLTSGMPAMEDLAFRIEREPWTDYPPGEYEAVPISSIRSYTVAAWGASS